MLRKCLKYDLQAIFRVWWIGAVIVLAAAFPVGACLGDMALKMEEPNYFPWPVFVGMLAYIGIIGFFILTMVLVFMRYYSNFFKDEGYLTFTLPVKRSTLYLSKLLNACIWYAATLAVIGAAFAIVIWMLPAELDSDFPFFSFFSIFTELFELIAETESGTNVVLWLELGVISVLSVVITLSMIHLCITIGATIARRYKVLAAIGAYYVGNIITSLVFLVGFMLALFWGFSASTLYPDAFPSSGNEDVLALFMAFAIIVMISWIAILTCINLRFLEKKLNLS